MAKKVEVKKNEKKSTKKVEAEVVEKETAKVEVKTEKSTKTNWLVKNKSVIIALVVGVVLGAGVMLILWPDRIAKLKDGTEVIAEIDGYKVTADDLYSELKNDGGLESLLSLIDDQILETKYSDSADDAKTDAEEQAEYYYSMYETYYGYTKEEFLSANGFTEEDFLKYLTRNYYYEKYYDEYVESLISDDDIQKEYENVFGDKTIYIFYSDENDELTSVRKDLKKGVAPADISYDSVTAKDYGTLTYADSANFSDTFISKIKDLKAGEYTKVFEDDSYGNVVVYVSEASDKPSFDDSKDNIVEVLKTEKENEDSNLYYKAIIKLRADNNLNISDTNLAKDYTTYKAKYEK